MTITTPRNSIPAAPTNSMLSLGQQALGSTILSAALVLPGMSVAYAEIAPEHGSISLKYLNYEDSQPGLKRITANSPSIAIVAPFAGEWMVEGTLNSDDVSGASPRYHTAVSGASKMHDKRTAGDVSLTRYFSNGTLTVGTAYSTEHDYISRALSIQGSVSSEDKNTSWTFGVGASNDRINPVNKIVVDEKRNTVDFLVGVTQALTAADIAQFTFTYGLGDGYFSDPYKAFDNRPRVRNKASLLAQWNHHFSGTDGTSRLSYRYYADTYQIKAHTLTGEYIQPLPWGWTVTPSARLYTQSAASFYFDPVYDARLGEPFPPGFVPGSNQSVSADQRLSGFGAITLGIKLAKQLTRDWSADIKWESYEQRGSWRMFHQGSPGLQPLRAQILQVGVSRQW